MGELLSVSEAEGEYLAALDIFEPFPFRHGLRRDTFPARGDSFWLVVAPKKAPRPGSWHGVSRD